LDTCPAVLQTDKQVKKCKKAADKKSMDSSRLKSIPDEQSGIKKSDGSPPKEHLKTRQTSRI
jgi:hypothetical protein